MSAFVELLNESIEFLHEHVGEDARLVYDGYAWAVDCVGFPQRLTLATGKTPHAATVAAVARFYELHRVHRNSL